MKLFLCSFFIPSFLLAADQIVMKNGDLLTGSIIKYDGKEIVMQSEFAGKVTIQWTAVTDVKSDNAIYVGLKDGNTVVGTVTTSDANLTVQTKDTGVVTTPKERVASMRNQAEQKAYERFKNPRLTQLWTGFADLGFAQSTGNAIVSTITTGGNATRVTQQDKITAVFTSIYSRSNASGTSVLTADAIRGGISYNRNVNKNLFAFGSTDLEYDEFQKLDLRFVPAAGFGHHLYKNGNTIFDLSGGASLNREFYSTGLNRTSGEAQFGDEFSRKFFKGTVLVKEKVVIYPNLTRTGEYRLNFDFSQATTLRKWLAWQVSFSNRYITNPAPGRKTNDLLMTTGFRVTFAR